MFRLTSSLLLCGALLAAQPASARAQDYFGTGPQRLTVEEEGSRTRNEKIALLALVGSSLAFGGLGTYFLRDSQSLSEAVSASGRHTGQAWSQELEATRSDAVRSGTLAAASYGVAGALLVAGVVTYIVTDPDTGWGSSREGQSYLLPTRGGAVAGRTWSF